MNYYLGESIETRELGFGATITHGLLFRIKYKKWGNLVLALPAPMSYYLEESIEDQGTLFWRNHHP